MGRHNDREVSKGSGIGLTFKFKNPLTSVKLSQAMTRVGSVLGAVTDLAHVVNEMGPNPKLRNYAALGVVMLSKLVESTGFNPEDDARFVTPALVWELQNSLRCIYAQLPATRMLGTGEKRYQITELDDGNVVVYQCSSNKETQGVWFVRNDTIEPHGMIPRLGREIWKVLGTRIELSMPTMHLSESNSGEIKKWHAGEILGSEQTDAVHDYVKKFLDKGYSRSVMLHGQPGTGKSCMVRSIVDRMARPTLFMEQRQVASMGSYSLLWIIELLQPEILVIDDFDRIPYLDSFLGSIDRIRETVKLFIVTVNNKDHMDPAVVRAGRFTDQIEVAQIRRARDIVPEVKGKLLVEIEESWPVAFVDELRDRIDVLGVEEALNDKGFAEMRARVIANTKERRLRLAPPDDKRMVAHTKG